MAYLLPNWYNKVPNSLNPIEKYLHSIDRSILSKQHQQIYQPLNRQSTQFLRQTLAQLTCHHFVYKTCRRRTNVQPFEETVDNTSNLAQVESTDIHTQIHKKQ